MRARILRPGEARDIDMGNFRMALKAAGEDTGSAFSLLEAEEPPHFGPPMHTHHDAAPRSDRGNPVASFR